MFLQTVWFGTETSRESYVELLSLRSITHLTLVDPRLFATFAQEWEDVIDEDVFPNLINFKLIFINAEIDGVSMAAALKRIAPRLETFTFGEGYLEAPPNLGALWSQFTNLKRLRVDLWQSSMESWGPRLAELPTRSLVSLTIGMLDPQVTLSECTNILSSFFSSRPAPLMTVRQLSLLNWVSAQPPYDEVGYREAQCELETVLEELGVTHEILKGPVSYEGLAISSF